MRLEKAIAWSLAIHLLVTGVYAISQGIKRCSRDAAPEAVFAELVPPPAVPLRDADAPPPVEKLAEERVGAVDGKAAPDAAPETPPLPAGTPDPAVKEIPVAAAPPPEPPAAPQAAEAAPATASVPDPVDVAEAGVPAPPADNAALARHATEPPAEPSRDAIALMHRQAMVSTADFYRNVPAELTRIVHEVLAGGALMSQGDALIHMDVTPSGQVGKAHVQANSEALLRRLERIEWAHSLPRRPLAACNAIHLRISVVGNDIRVRIEML